MVVEFLIEIKAMKDTLFSGIFQQEYKSFEDEIKAGKVSVTSDYDKSIIVVKITDKKLEEEFITKMNSFREKMGLKLMKGIGIFPKIIRDGKEVKI